jgi:hypothetical protein
MTDEINSILCDICSECPGGRYDSFGGISMDEVPIEVQKSFEDDAIVDKAIEQCNEYHTAVSITRGTIFEEKMLFNIICDICFKHKMIDDSVFWKRYNEIYDKKKIYEYLESIRT